jgi:hypothetical protein
MFKSYLAKPGYRRKAKNEKLMSDFKKRWRVREIQAMRVRREINI